MKDLIKLNESMVVAHDELKMTISKLRDHKEDFKNMKDQLTEIKEKNKTFLK